MTKNSKSLKFDLKKYIYDTEQVLIKATKNDWYRRRYTKRSLVRTVYSFARELETTYRFYFPIWLTRFSGKVPEKWEWWKYVFEDIENAKEHKIRLDPTLIDAAIMHPIFVIGINTATSQKLDVRQLAFILSRPTITEGNKEKIIDCQLMAGMNKKDVKQAVKVAEHVKEKLVKWHKKHHSFVLKMNEHGYDSSDETPIDVSEIKNLRSKKEVKTYLEGKKKSMKDSSISLALFVDSLLSSINSGNVPQDPQVADDLLTLVQKIIS